MAYLSTVDAVQLDGGSGWINSRTFASSPWLDALFLYLQ